MTIKTYPEMDSVIVAHLRWGVDNPMLLYAAQRIEELEAEAGQAQRRYDSLQIRFDATQRVLTRELEKNRVRDECLAIAMKALRWYNSDALIYREANEALVEIERRLAELELEEKTE